MFWHECFQLVNMLAVVIDKYGRILIPKDVRERLGLRPGTTLELLVKGNEIVLRPFYVDLERRVKEVAEYLAREAPKAFVNVPRRGDSKWLSREYCLRKLGLSKE